MCDVCADISFWKEKKNLEGLSVRTIFVNCITQFIILLYLFDNDTSWIILISASVGLLIEAWKITKAVEVRLTSQPPFARKVKVSLRTPYILSALPRRRLQFSGPTAVFPASASRTGPPTPPGPRSLYAPSARPNRRGSVTNFSSSFRMWQR